MLLIFIPQNLVIQFSEAFKFTYFNNSMFADSNDRKIPFHSLWAQSNTIEWVEKSVVFYEFEVK